MRFPLISIGNSNNMFLEAGKRRADKDGQPKTALLAGHTAPQILAITVPLATTVTSVAWAIAACLIVRERSRAQVEMARFAAETGGQGSISESSSLLIPGDRSL